MTKQIHPTTQSLGLGSAVGPGFDASVDDLRNGEREAFGRFFETYRSGIYGFVARLMRGRGDAAAITHEVFVRAYRKILLHSGAIDLRPWVYGVAFDTCREHLAAAPGSPAMPAAPQPDAATGADPQSDLARRFRQASEGLNDRDLAALLLNDVHGLSYGETAAVMGVSTEAAKTLLFRAGERFRGAFEALSGNQTVATCRFAEQEAATSVGRGLSADDTRRLHDHARYCEPCRTTTAAWGVGAAGLALFVGEAPLPQALQKVPVFGTWAAPVAPAQAAPAGVAAGTGAVVGALVSFRKVVSSKATAYVVAAACLAALAGVVMFGSHRELQKIILFVPRPPASSAIFAPHDSAKVAVVPHTARKGTPRAATHATQSSHSAVTASTALIATANLTSVHSSGVTQSGDGAASSSGTHPTSGTGSTTGGTGSTTGGGTTSSTGRPGTAGHSTGAGATGAVGTAVGVGLSRAVHTGHTGHAAQSHRHAKHDGCSHRRAGVAARSQSRSHSGARDVRSHSGSSGRSHSRSRGDAANGGARRSHGGGRGQRSHASRGSRGGSARGSRGGARGRGHGGNGRGRSDSRGHGRGSARG